MARAGRFGTKGLAITFVSDEADAKILNDVQDRFEVNVAELPDEIDISTYSKSNVYKSYSQLSQWCIKKMVFKHHVLMITNALPLLNPSNKIA